MAVPMSRTDGTWRVVMEGEGSVQIPSNLFVHHQRYPNQSEAFLHTRGDVSISLQASLYRTVGEFFENSSEVRAYRRRAENPAPKMITTRLPVLEAVRTACWQERKVRVTVSITTTHTHDTHLFRQCSVQTTSSYSLRSALMEIRLTRTAPLYLLSGIHALHPASVRAGLTRCSGV